MSSALTSYIELNTKSNFWQTIRPHILLAMTVLPILANELVSILSTLWVMPVVGCASASANATDECQIPSLDDFTLPKCFAPLNSTNADETPYYSCLSSSLSFDVRTLPNNVIDGQQDVTLWTVTLVLFAALLAIAIFLGVLLRQLYVTRVRLHRLLSLMIFVSVDRRPFYINLGLATGALAIYASVKSYMLVRYSGNAYLVPCLLGPPPALSALTPLANTTTTSPMVWVLLDHPMAYTRLRFALEAIVMLAVFFSPLFAIYGRIVDFFSDFSFSVLAKTQTPALLRDIASIRRAKVSDIEAEAALMYRRHGARLASYSDAEVEAALERIAARGALRPLSEPSGEDLSLSTDQF